MSKHRRDEAVTVSFHYLVREVHKKDEEPKTTPFSQDEFNYLCDRITNQPKVDESNPETLEALKRDNLVPFFDIVKIGTGDRCLFGKFEGTYWGHAYRNSKRGKIPADSINQRKFHFILYLSDSGKIYIGCQYLGLYGAYTALQKTLRSYLSDKKNVVAKTFHQHEVNYKDALAKEVKVTLSSKGKTITSDNIFENGSMLAVKKRSTDDNFEENVKTNIFSLLKSPVEKRRKAIAQLMKDALIEVNDDDIDNCTVLASINGRDRIIYVLGGYNFASRFHLDVEINFDGHPKSDQTQQAMYEALANEIIARREDG